MYENSLFQEPDNKFGFVYIVSCHHPECTKQYIGLKFFYRNWGKKTKQTDSDWRTYKTSSKYVKEAIEKYGIEFFSFTIVQLFDTRAGVVSGEVELQWAARVLHAVDANGERSYWNQAIGNIKFVAKEQLSEETKQKMMGNSNAVGAARSAEHKAAISKAQKGKVVGDKQKEAIIKSNKRQVMSESGREAIRQSNKRRNYEQENR